VSSAEEGPGVCDERDWMREDANDLDPSPLRSKIAARPPLPKSPYPFRKPRRSDDEDLGFYSSSTDSDQRSTTSLAKGRGKSRQGCG
jgi:hypothetical protein